MVLNISNDSGKSVKNQIWAIGGGKGGVGKSLITVSLGLWLAKLGKKVILLDGDLGGANLHSLLGIKHPRYTLNDFINKKVKYLGDLAADTPMDGLKLISGTSDLLNMANPKFVQKIKIIKQIDQLEADYILLDLGAGSSFNILDFFLISDEKIVVLNPQFLSIQNAYGFIKNSIFRKFSRSFPPTSQIYSLIQSNANKKDQEDKKNTMGEFLNAIKKIDEAAENKMKDFLKTFSPKLITNMIKQPKDREAAKMIKIVSEKYLNINAMDLGCVYYDNSLDKSVNSITAFSNPNFSSELLKGSYEIVTQLIKKTG